MPLIEVKMIEQVFTPAEKKELIAKLTNVVVEMEGEAFRPYTVVLLEDVRSGSWGVGGQGLTTEDVKALAGKKSA
jgi:4-oxalocrotonate tautomerase